MFEFVIGDIDRGASISFLSQFPGEDEILIPPLSYLEVTGEACAEFTDKGNVTIFPGRINCNMKSQTIQEIETRRHRELVAMMPYLQHDLERDVAILSRLMVQNSLLFDDKTHEEGAGCHFRLDDVASSDKAGIQPWFTTPALHGIPSSVELACLWQFDGSGPSNGSIYARATGQGNWTALSSEKAPHKAGTFRARFPAEICIGAASYPLKLELGYYHNDQGLIITEAGLSIEGAVIRKPSIQQHSRRAETESVAFAKMWGDFKEAAPKRYDYSLFRDDQSSNSSPHLRLVCLTFVCSRIFTYICFLSFNDDTTYKEAISAAISFRTGCIRRLLVRSSAVPLPGIHFLVTTASSALQDVEYPLHRLVNILNYEELLDMGFNVDEQDEVGIPAQHVSEGLPPRTFITALDKSFILALVESAN